MAVNLILTVSILWLIAMGCIVERRVYAWTCHHGYSACYGVRK
jgi:hypothetical protein